MCGGELGDARVSAREKGSCLAAGRRERGTLSFNQSADGTFILSITETINAHHFKRLMKTPCSFQSSWGHYSFLSLWIFLS